MQLLAAGGGGDDPLLVLTLCRTHTLPEGQQGKTAAGL